jgi:hypothetical protein
MRVRSPSTHRRSLVLGQGRDVSADEPLIASQRRRVVRSRSSQGRFQSLSSQSSRSQGSQGFDMSAEEDGIRQELRQDRRLSNVELVQVKQQLGEARHKVTMLERKCDQQTRELTKLKAENEKHVANIKCLTDQIRQMKQDRSRSQDRLPRPSSHSGQFERQWNSVRQSSASRGRVRTKDKDSDTDDRIFHKQALDNLMNKCNEEFDLIKSQLKSQEVAFQGLQRGFSLDRIPRQDRYQMDNDKPNGVQRQSRSKKHSMTPPNSSSMDSVLSQTSQDGEDKNGSSERHLKLPENKQTELTDSVAQTEEGISVQSENDTTSLELNVLKTQLQEQQNLIHEQWKLIKNKEAAIGKERVQLDNELKFRTDELEIQLKDAEENLARERESHTRLLTKVQSEAMQNKHEMAKKLDVLTAEIKNMASQNSKTRENASILERENADLKGMLQKYQHELQEQKQQLQMQYLSRSSVMPPSNPMAMGPASVAPIHQTLHHPTHQTHSSTPTLSRAASCVNRDWVVPRVMYEDERLAKMLKEVLFRLDKRAELAVLGAHEILPHHSGRVLIPVIGSAGVVSNIQAALEKVNLGKFHSTIISIRIREKPTALLTDI